MKILICDDDREIARAIGIYLRNAGYETCEVYDGRSAVEAAKDEEVQLIMMDVMMPGIDGIRATEAIRRVRNIPIIMVSAKGESYDKVSGLDCGADDYITKPFDPVEMVARVRACLRRYKSLGSAEEGPSVLKTGGLRLDTETKVVTVDGEEVSLTPKEFGVLKFLMEQPGRVYSMEQIYEAVWKEPAFNFENTVAVHIRHIREKIEIDPRNPAYLKVLWGIGYKIEKIDEPGNETKGASGNKPEGAPAGAGGGPGSGK